MSQATNNNRLIVASIVGLPLTMILAATWLWYFVVRGELDVVGALGTANRGELVQPPRQLDEAPLKRSDGSDFDVHSGEPRWTFVVPQHGARCDTSCEHLLYLTRQIHLAMGKEFTRIQRYYLSDTKPQQITLAVDSLSDGHPLPASFSAYLEQEQADIEALQVPAAWMGELFPENAAAPDTWYLVDPAGWIMMTYDDSVTYKDVIADLKFLLKNSSD